MGIEQLMWEGKKHSPKGHMTNCLVLLSSAVLQPAPPLPVGSRQDRLGW